MDRKVKILLLAALIVGAIPAWGQRSQVRGHVSDASGAPLPAVAVVEKGTTNGVLSDASGAYSIQVPSGAVLEVSCMGYTTQEVSVAGRSSIDIVLEEDLSALEEVVVIGYGTIRRATLANSVATVRNDELLQGAVANPLQMLQGRVAGLGVGITSGDPNNANPQMMLRGVSTLMSNQQPIIVVDGVVVANMNNVSPDEVESVDVLKDGAAAAIYGTRGNNGVIIITTKRQKASRAAINYHGYVSTESISSKVKVFSPEEYRQLGELSDGAFTPLDNGYSTDWQKEVFRVAVNQYHNLSLTAGDGHNGYYANGTVQLRNGIIRGSGLNKYQVSAGFHHFFFEDKLKVAGNVAFIKARGTKVSEETAYLGSRMANPTSPVYNPATGEYSIFAEVPNPVRSINEFREDIDWHNVDISGEVVYAPFKFLTFNAQGRFTQFAHFNGSYATKRFDENQLNGQAWRNTSSNTTRTLEVFSQFSKRFGFHDVTAVAGYSFFQYDTGDLSTYNYDYPTDAFEYNNLGLGLALKDGNASMNSSRSMNRLVSFFGRVNYSYRDKYIAALSIREDGSSKFGPKHRWGTFWSASAAWRISQEGFMKNVTWLDELKLKFSYGVTGVEPSSPYLSQQTYSYGSPAYMDGKWIYTISPARVSNPDLKWEEKHEMNLGIDFSMFNRRFSGSLDLYDRKTRDLLYSYSVPVPPNLASTIYANVGSIANRGIELQLSGVPVKTGDFTLTLAGNVSFNSNRIISLSNEHYTRDYMEVGSTGAPVQKTTHIVRQDGAVGDFYGWKSTGIKKNGVWICEGGSYGSEEARQVIGNGIPKIFAGLVINAAWKGFDLGISLRGAFLYQVLNQYRMLWETFQRGQQYNYPVTILEHPYGGETVLKNTSPSYVSYFVENGDFLKIDNVTLGYNFSFRNRKVVKSLRVYASGLNLFTFTGYKGIDPEVGFTGLAPGIEYTSRYPVTRTVSLGVKVGF